MKSTLFTTLLSLATMTLMVMTVGSSGLRGLQSISAENLASTPTFKISGLANLLQILNSASEFTNSTFDVITVDSFSQTNTDGAVEYAGKVTLANDQGYNVTGLINGTWDPSSNKLTFSASPYVENSGNGGETENGTNNTNTTTPSNPAVPVGYTYISNDDLANNQIAQGALAAGVDSLIQTAISQYKVPAASPEYNVTNLNLAAYRNASYGQSFIFYTNLTNDLNYKVDANLTVRYFSSNQTYRLAGYSFHSYGYPASAIVIPQANASNNTNATNQTIPVIPDNTNTTVIVDNSTGSENTTIIVDNPNLPQNETVISNNTAVDNSTVIIPPINETIPLTNTTNNTTPVNNTTPSNNTTPVNNTAPQVTSDGYTILSADQLANDSIGQGALQAGANALIQKALTQNKIPAANANYTINNIYFAGAKRQVIGTSYKFAVNMTNVDYVHVDANLTVFYRYSTKAYSLNGYWFKSYNYSSTALQNNNVTVPIVNSTSPTNTTTVAANNTVVANATNSGSR